MYSIGQPYSKRVSMLNLALYTLYCHENSLHSCFLDVCILRPIRPVTMTKTAHNIVECKFRGNE